ncbi:MAG: hypothetical protein WBJ81_06905 [Rickettsiales bacterium]
MNKNIKKENKVETKPVAKKNLEKIALALKQNLLRRKAKSAKASVIASTEDVPITANGLK